MKKALSIFVLCLMLSGCVFSMARMRSVVIDSEAKVYGTIPGQSYKLRNMEGKIEDVTFKQDWYVVNDAALVKVEDKKNKKFFRGVKGARNKKIAGGTLIAILGILLQVMKLKKKIDKGEEISISDILNVFKFKKGKKK